jgi:hypothetical protein
LFILDRSCLFLAGIVVPEREKSKESRICQLPIGYKELLPAEKFRASSANFLINMIDMPLACRFAQRAQHSRL